MAASFASRLSSLREKKINPTESGTPLPTQKKAPDSDSPSPPTPHKNHPMNPPTPTPTSAPPLDFSKEE